MPVEVMPWSKSSAGLLMPAAGVGWLIPELDDAPPTFGGSPIPASVGGGRGAASPASGPSL
eukprot:13077581-Alexandrium_andersonii.AAC.1